MMSFFRAESNQFKKGTPPKMPGAFPRALAIAIKKVDPRTSPRMIVIGP